MLKRQLPTDQITKMIERQNVITFKRRHDQKSAKSKQDEEEESESKVSSNHEENNYHKFNQRNLPLPQILRQKKRIFTRNLQPQIKTNGSLNYVEKQVRQHDNIMLKNTNNFLTNQNMKLKTKNMNLEKEIVKLQKIIEEDPQKVKVLSIKQSKPKANQIVNLKISMKNIIKQLEETKKQNLKIKTSIKFTTINELEIQRDAIFEETQRLREMLQQQKSRTNLLKANQQVFSSVEQKIGQLQQKNMYLTRQNNELKSRVSKVDEKDRGSAKLVDNEKNLNKLLLSAKKVIKDKDKELEMLKIQLKKVSSLGKVDSVKVVQKTAAFQISKKKSNEIVKVQNKLNEQTKQNKEKRMMSKSAQKYRSTVHVQAQECQTCKSLKAQNIQLSKLIQNLKNQLQQKAAGRHMINHPASSLCKAPIAIPTDQQISTIKRYLVHRFQAHRLSLSQATLHLINYEGHDENLEAELTVAEFVQISMAEPFSIISLRYIQVFISKIFYPQEISKKNESLRISETDKLKKKEIKQRFMSLVGQYELINQNKEEQMFIQIAQLITQYQQHILKALSQKRNSQNTINQVDFYKFFKEIELQEDYIHFMISQIILESIDLDHLNIYNLFQIFYLPPQEQMMHAQANSMGISQGKKYNFIEGVVKQQDEQYEQSKSFHESRQKTLSKHDKSIERLQNQEYRLEQEDYQQNFQEQKKEKKDQNDLAVPQYYQIQNNEEEYIEQYEN